ncbi:MAG: hypothetical protein F7B17_00555 [Desulfurococcales archaeon]|nr:hypothetical protein [Desulfurococcales archaeon]
MVDLWRLGAAVYAFAVLIWLIESIEDVDSQGVALLSGLLGILIMIVGSILAGQCRREK